MKIFKNKVGRPSNESIKRKKIFKIIIVVLVLLAGIITVDKVYQYNNDIESTAHEASVKKMVSVTFDANGGKVSGKSKVTYNREYKGKYSAPTPTGVSGDKFEGWYTAKTGGKKVTDTTKVSSTSSHTLYAHWGSTYKVDFKQNGSKSISSTTATCYKPNDKTSCEVKMPSITAKDGFNVVGWNTQPSTTTAIVNQKKKVNVTTRSTTYYAITKSKTVYTATFNKNGAQSISATSRTCYRYNGSSSCKVDMPNITAKSGFVVLGWNKSAKSTSSVASVGSSYGISGDTNFYAVTKSTNPYRLIANGKGVYSVNGKKDYSEEFSCYRYNGGSSCSITLPKGISTNSSDYNGKTCKGGGDYCKGYTVNGWECSYFGGSRFVVSKDNPSFTIKQSELNEDFKSNYYQVACSVSMQKDYKIGVTKKDKVSISSESGKVTNKLMGSKSVYLLDPDTLPNAYLKGSSLEIKEEYDKNNTKLKSITISKTSDKKRSDLNIGQNFVINNMAFEVDSDVDYNLMQKYKPKLV